MPYLQQFLKCLTVFYNISAESHVLPKLSCHPTSGATFQPCVWIAPRGTGQSPHCARSYNLCELSACTQVIGHVIGEVSSSVGLHPPLRLLCCFVCLCERLVIITGVVTHLSEKVVVRWDGATSPQMPNETPVVIYWLKYCLKTLQDPGLPIEASQEGGKRSQLSWPLLNSKAEELYSLEKFLQNTRYSRRITSTCPN